jgi:hypothetical protein
MLQIFGSLDSDRESELLQLKLIAGLSPEERFLRMCRLCAFGKQAMLEGLREKHPDMSEDQLRVVLARNLWGEDFAEQVAERIACDHRR